MLFRSGGPAAILAKNSIKSVEVVAFEELGMEAIRKIRVENFPAFIIAERAAAKGISVVSFDRNGYLYHGRVKQLADAAREGGLKF